MRQIIILISLSYMLCFSIDTKAQSSVDSLENTVIKYLKSNKDNVTKQNTIVVKFYAIPTKYIIYIQGYSDKICEKDISNSNIYKAFSLDEKRNVYFANNFIKPLQIERNNTLFLTDSKCDLLDEKWIEPEIIMLLIDNKFSIKKETKGNNYNFLTQELLCTIHTENPSEKKKQIKLSN